MRRPLVFAVLVGSACQSTIVFPPPPAADANALLLLVEGGDDRLVFATEPTGDGAFLPPLPVFAAVEGLSLHAASYACTLEELELAPGKQVLGEPTTPLAEPSAVQVYESGSWRALEPTREESARFDRLPWSSACDSAPSIELAPNMIDFERYVQEAAPLSGDDVVLLTTDSNVQVLSDGAVISTTETSTIVETIVPLSGGRVAFVQLSGVVFLATAETAASPDAWVKIDSAFAPPALLDGIAAAARPIPGSTGFLAVTGLSTIEYFDGAAWHRLIQHPSRAERLAVAWKNADEAAVIGFAGGAGMATVNVATREVEVASVEGVPDECRLSAIAWVEPVGWVYGTCNRVLLGGRAYPADVGREVLFLVKHDASAFMAAGKDGFVLFDAQRLECVQTLFPLDIYLSILAQTERGVFWLGGISMHRARYLYFRPELERRPECQL